jgi:hypothetical protein
MDITAVLLNLRKHGVSLERVPGLSTSLRHEIVQNSLNQLLRDGLIAPEGDLTQRGGDTAAIQCPGVSP